MSSDVHLTIVKIDNLESSFLQSYEHLLNVHLSSPPSRRIETHDDESAVEMTHDGSLPISH